MRLIDSDTKFGETPSVFAVAPYTYPQATYPLAAFPVAAYSLAAYPLAAFPLATYPEATYLQVAYPLAAFNLAAYPEASIASGYPALLPLNRSIVGFETTVRYRSSLQWASA